MRVLLLKSVAPVALALALLGQANALVHLGVVRHDRCAEHGELVERAQARSPTAPAAPVFQSERAGVDATTGVVADDDSHEHCAALMVARASTAPPSAIAGKPHAATPLRVVVAFARVPSTQQPYRTAPKTSPPVV